MRTWLRSGSGIGRSTSSKSPPALTTCTAFMLRIACPPETMGPLGTRSDAGRQYTALADAFQRQAVLALRDDDTALTGAFRDSMGSQLECRSDDGQHAHDDQDPDVSPHRLTPVPRVVLLTGSQCRGCTEKISAPCVHVGAGSRRCGQQGLRRPQSFGAGLVSLEEPARELFDERPGPRACRRPLLLLLLLRFLLF